MNYLDELFTVTGAKETMPLITEQELDGLLRRFQVESSLIQQHPQRRDTSAWELYEGTIKILRRFVWPFVCNNQDADDVIQEVFQKISESILNYTSEGKSFGWFFTIARNAALDYIKRNHPELNQVRDPSEGFVDSLADEIDEDRRRELLFTEAQQKLPLKYRVVVMLKYYGRTEDQRVVTVDDHVGELTHQQIGEILGISESNSQTLLSRALQNLRQHLVKLAPKYGFELVVEDEDDEEDEERETEAVHSREELKGTVDES